MKLYAIVGLIMLAFLALNAQAGQIYIPDGNGNVNIYNTYDNNGTMIVVPTETYQPNPYNPAVPGY